MSPRQGITLVSLSFLLVACGNGGHKETRSQASANLKAMVDSTATAIGQGMTVTVGPNPFLAQACTDALGKDQGTVKVGYGAVMALRSDIDVPALLNRAREHWTADRYKVGDILGAETPAPSLHAERDGYGLLLNVDRENRKASIDGSTPCVPGDSD